MAKKDELDLEKQLEQMAASRRGRDLGRKIAEDIVDGIGDELDSKLPQVVENLDALQSRNVGPTVSSPNAALESRKKAAQRDKQVIKEIVKIEQETNDEIEELIEAEREKQAALRKLAEQRKVTDRGYYNKGGTFVKTGGAKTTIIAPRPDEVSQNAFYGRDVGGLKGQLNIKEGVVRSSLPSMEKGATPADIAATKAYWFKGALSSVFQRGAIDTSKLSSGMTSANAPRLAGTGKQLQTIFDDLGKDPSAQFYLREIASKYVEGHIMGSLWQYRKLLGARGYNVNQLMPASSLTRHAEFLGMGARPGSAPYRPPAAAPTSTGAEQPAVQAVIQQAVGKIMDRRNLKRAGAGALESAIYGGVESPALKALLSTGSQPSNAFAAAAAGMGTGAGLTGKQLRDLNIQKGLVEGRSISKKTNDFSNWGQMPQEGYIVHISAPELANTIKTTGLSYRNQGMLQSTAGFASTLTELDTVIAQIRKDARFASGTANIFKMSPDEWKQRNDVTKTVTGDVVPASQFIKHMPAGVSDQLAGMMHQHAANVVVKATKKAAAFMDASNVNIPAVEEEPEFINAIMNKALGGISTGIHEAATKMAGSSITTTFGTSLATGIGGPIKPPGPAELAALAKVTQQQAANLVQQSVKAAPMVGTQTSGGFMGKATMAGAAGFRQFYQGNVFTDAAAYEQAKQMVIQKAISKQYQRLEKATGANVGDVMLLHARLGDILDPVMKTGAFIKQLPKGIQLTVQQVEQAANEIKQKWIARQPPTIQAAMGGGGATPDILAGTSFSKMDMIFGKTYKIKVAAMTAAALDNALKIGAGAPGYAKGQADIMQSGAGLPGVIGGASGTITGRVKSKADLAKVLAIHQQIAGGADIDDQKTTIHLMDERLSLQSSLNSVADKLNKIQMGTVRAQMSMLGIYFSMLSVVNMIGRAWSALSGHMSNLGTMFKSLAEGIAFGGQFSKAQGFLRGMLGDTNNLVTAWKNYTGLMGIFNSMLTYIAYKVFTNQELMHKIDNVIGNIVELINDPTFIPSIIDLFDTVIKNLPDIINGIQVVVGVLRTISGMPGFDKLIGSFLQTAIYAAILMPVLANLGAVFSVLSYVISGVAWALGVDLPAAWAAFKAAFTAGWLVDTFTAGWAALAGAGTLGMGALIASITAGVGLGFATVWVMVNTGFTKFLADLGNKLTAISPAIMDLLKIILVPFGALGTMIIDVVTGQFANIPKDLANIIAQAIAAAVDLVGMIPVVGPAIVKALSGVTTFNAGVLASTTTSTKVPHAATGGYVEASGLAVIHKGENIIPAGGVSSQQTTQYVTFHQTINVKNPAELSTVMKNASAMKYGYTGSASK